MTGLRSEAVTPALARLPGSSSHRPPPSGLAPAPPTVLPSQAWPLHLLRSLILFVIRAFVMVGELHGSFQDPHQALLRRLCRLQALNWGEAWAAEWPGQLPPLLGSDQPLLPLKTSRAEQPHSGAQVGFEPLCLSSLRIPSSGIPGMSHASLTALCIPKMAPGASCMPGQGLPLLCGLTRSERRTRRGLNYRPLPSPGCCPFPGACFSGAPWAWADPDRLRRASAGRGPLCGGRVGVSTEDPWAAENFGVSTVWGLAGVNRTEGGQERRSSEQPPD